MVTLSTDGMITGARELADRVCRGHIVDEAPAFAHAVKVSVVVRRDIPDAPGWLVAAALLHDYPEFATEPDVTGVLTRHVGVEGCAVVEAMHRLHAELNAGAEPVVDASWDAFVWLFVADQVVAFESLLRRAHRSGDPHSFITDRRALMRLLPWFGKTQTRLAARVPDVLARRHRGLLAAVTDTAGGLSGPKRLTHLGTLRSEQPVGPFPVSLPLKAAGHQR